MELIGVILVGAALLLYNEIRKLEHRGSTLLSPFIVVAVLLLVVGLGILLRSALL